MKANSALNNFNDKPDEALVKLAQAKGDQEAYAALFLRHREVTYPCIMSVVHNDEVAKDLFQSTYIKGWLKIQTLKDPSRFKPWLLMIARNLAYDWLRQNSSKKFLTLEEIEVTDDTNPFEVVANTDEARYILAHMDPILRDVLLLNAQGYSRAEIARQLGFKEGTITTYLSQARTQFQQFRCKVYLTDGNQKGE